MWNLRGSNRARCLTRRLDEAAAAGLRCYRRSRPEEIDLAANWPGLGLKSCVDRLIGEKCLGSARSWAGARMQRSRTMTKLGRDRWCGESARRSWPDEVSVGRALGSGAVSVKGKRGQQYGVGKEGQSAPAIGPSDAAQFGTLTVWADERSSSGSGRTLARLRAEAQG